MYAAQFAWTYGLSGPKMNIELFRIIGTFLGMFLLLIIRLAFRKLVARFLRDILFSRNRKNECMVLRNRLIK